jgi:hydrogenase maturation protease
MRRVVVFACGEPLRGDDGAGPASVERLSAASMAMAEVRTCGSLSVEDLLALPDEDSVIVVDAVTGPAPGELVREPLADLDRVAAGWTPVSGHQLSLAATVALADALGWRCRGTFLGVGASSFGLGEGMSEPVMAALPALTTAIDDEVAALSRS